MNLIRTHLDDDGLAFYDCQSRSRPGKWHSPVIDIYEGIVDCTCEDFDFKKGAGSIQIKVTNIRQHCIHIEAALNDCIRRGEVRVICSTFAPQFRRGVLTND